MYWFMSFADGPVNLGVCVVKAATIEAALKEAAKRLLIPAGTLNVLYVGQSQADFEAEGLELNRLYTKAEMEEMGYKIHKTNVHGN